MTPTPKDLGGYQNICMGKVMAGDLLIPRGCLSPDEWFLAECTIGDTISDIKESGFRVYRKMPVAKQGDIDHGQEVPATQSVSSQSLPREIAATHDDGKPPLALLPMAGLRAVAQVQAYGHKKYGSFFNFKKGIQHSRAISCAMRHLAAHMDGETYDKESSQLHLAHAACRILFLIENMNDSTDIDDRFKKE